MEPGKNAASALSCSQEHKLRQVERLTPVSFPWCSGDGWFVSIQQLLSSLIRLPQTPPSFTSSRLSMHLIAVSVNDMSLNYTKAGLLHTVFSEWLPSRGTRTTHGSLLLRLPSAHPELLASRPLCPLPTGSATCAGSGGTVTLVAGLGFVS